MVISVMAEWLVWLLLGLGLAVAGSAIAGDAVKGEKIFKKCNGYATMWTRKRIKLVRILLRC